MVSVGMVMGPSRNSSMRRGTCRAGGPRRVITRARDCQLLRLCEWTIVIPSYRLQNGARDREVRRGGGGSGVRGFPRGYVDSGKRADVSRVLTTAIIHAGRVSLDEKRSVELVEEGGKWKMV